MFALATVVLERLGDGLWNAIQMAWEVGRALVLLFLGWQFTLAEFVGGIVLVTLMWAGVRLLVTCVLEADVRTHAEAARAGHQHTMAVAEDVP